MEFSTSTPQSCSSSIFPLTHHLQLQPCRLKMPAFHPLPGPRAPAPALLVKFGRWDSNAEEKVPGKRFGSDPGDEERLGSRQKKRRWWSAGNEADAVEEEKEEGIAEDVLESIWILKVFRSYGWALPAALISLLLATGPKAFLMSMALPLGVSVVTFAYYQLLGKKRTKPMFQTGKGKRRRRRTRSSKAASSFGSKEVGGRSRTWKKSRKGSFGSQSWVDEENFSSESGNGASSFGGWEELEGVRYGERPPAEFSRSSGNLTSTNEAQAQAPLLLRLLIAMFPFLGLWTKMFW